MKKTDYNTKTRVQLETELKDLRTAVAKALAKGSAGKNTKEYTTARKNIARALTALAALPAVITASSHGASSTEA